MNYCKNCGKELSGSKRHNVYCDNKCQSAFQEKEYVEKWKRHEINGLTGEYQISRYVKNYLIKKANFCCEQCGWGEVNIYTGKVPLEIHHIDGDYNNTYEENLQVLCPNCHSLTPNFKSRGQGREDRKKYYMTNTCIDCGTVIANTSTRCRECEIKHRNQEILNNIPISRENLKFRIRTETFAAIARDYNMSANGIKRWMEKYNLPTTKIKINSYSDEEWENI